MVNGIDYPTWAVNLWLHNEESLYFMCMDLARHEQDVSKLAEIIRDLIMNNAPDLGASMYSDILIHGLQSVDWLYIARDFKDAVEE